MKLEKILKTQTNITEFSNDDSNNMHIMYTMNGATVDLYFDGDGNVLAANIYDKDGRVLDSAIFDETGKGSEVLISYSGQKDVEPVETVREITPEETMSFWAKLLPTPDLESFSVSVTI